MSFRRPRLRSRRNVIDIHFGDQPCYVWLPNPDDPVIVAEFADAANLATAVLDMPVEKEVMVLLDERRQVTAMFADPPTELGLFVGWCDGPGLEVPFSQTMMICVADQRSCFACQSGRIKGDCNGLSDQHFIACEVIADDASHRTQPVALRVTRYEACKDARVVVDLDTLRVKIARRNGHAAAAVDASCASPARCDYRCFAKAVGWANN